MAVTPIDTQPSSTSLAEGLEQIWSEPLGLASALSTVDHKKIGKRYLYTGLLFFALGGIESLLMRVQLAQPGLDVLDPESYNQLFSMHGTTMMFLFAIPVLSGFGNYFVPLMIGARDMAFPRLNAFGYWVFLASGCSVLELSARPGAQRRWFNYPPPANSDFSPGINIDFYLLGLLLLGLSTTAGAINFIVTILKLRVPGMSINRMPVFVWGELALGLAIVFAQPPLTLGLAMMLLDRTFNFNFFSSAGGGDPVLWQHLFRIFGHPCVSIIVLPAFGIVLTMLPVLARRRIVG